MTNELPVASSGPYFVADVFSEDLGATPNFAALAAHPRVVGCILKATDAIFPAVPGWFVTNWNRVRAAGGSRYGSSWFRGCYHFGRPTMTGAAQADLILNAVERAGGFSDGDAPPAWDLEGASWASSSNQQVIDISSQFAQRIRSRIGRAPFLYAGSLIRDRGITDHMGFSKLWTPHLGMTKAAWPTSQYALWQYAGDGGRGWSFGGSSFPLAISGWGATDMSVVMDGGAPAASIGAVRKALINGGGLTVPLLIGGALLALGAMMARYRSRERLQ